MSENRPPPLLPNTRIAAMPASGAIPGAATTPPEVMMPATLVPWPSVSAAAPGPDWVAPPFGQQPRAGDGWSSQKHCCATTSSARSGWVASMPLSITAAVMPAPVYPCACAVTPPTSAVPCASTRMTRPSR